MLHLEVTAPTYFEIQKMRKKNNCVKFFTSPHGKVSQIRWWCRQYSLCPMLFGESHWEPKPHSCCLLLLLFFLFVFVFLIYFRFNLLFTSPAAFFCLWVCHCLWMSPSGPLSFPHTEPSSVTSKEDTAKANNNKWLKKRKEKKKCLHKSKSLMFPPSVDSSRMFAFVLFCFLWVTIELSEGSFTSFFLDLCLWDYIFTRSFLLASTGNWASKRWRRTHATDWHFLHWWYYFAITWITWTESPHQIFYLFQCGFGLRLLKGVFFIEVNVVYMAVLKETY